MCQIYECPRCEDQDCELNVCGLCNDITTVLNRVSSGMYTCSGAVLNFERSDCE